MAEEKLIQSSPNDVPAIVKRLYDGFNSRKTFSKDYRRRQLQQLKLFLQEHEKDICAALKADLGKCKMEALLMENGLITNDLIVALRDLDKWMEPRPVGKDLATALSLSSPYLIPEPLGVVAIIGAWNYPLQLTILPLIGAVAAGNAVLLKPSEVSVATSNLLSEQLPKYLDQECFQVVPGGVEVGKAVLKEKFDHIFYTGSTNVGKIVMQSAAKHLTPVTLELGGKSPCIVMEDANIDKAAKRIAWGKFANAGQTCIAPDYVLCQEGAKRKFLDSIQKHILTFFTENPDASPDFGRIVNINHFNRLDGILQKTKGNVVIGGKAVAEEKFISPTVIDDVTPDDATMSDELFGPILPILTVKSADEAVTFVRKREKPLSLYLFTESSQVKDLVRTYTSSGAFIVNDTILHAGLSSLPFGGIGNSGIGAYHGKFTFDTFSHLKPCLETKPMMDFAAKGRYPPYTDANLKTLLFLLKPRQFPFKTFIRVAVVISILVYLIMVGAFLLRMFKVI